MSKRFPMPIPYGWFGVAYSDEIQPGQALPARYFGRDLVIFRTESGRAAVTDAYCPHMGAHLGYGIHEHMHKGGEVRGESIVCPVHGWQFNADGYCTSVPYAKQMPPKVQDKQCLPTYPTVERNQVIWAWYHPEGAAPMWEVLAHDEANDDNWGEFQRFEWKIKTHSQEMAENAADPAHFHYVHGVATFPESTITYEGPVARGEQLAKLATPRGEVNGAIRTFSLGPGQGSTRFSGICETFLMALTTPVDEENVHVRFAFNQPKKDGKTQTGGVAAAIIKDICRQLDEDTPIWENKIYRPQPILCDGDGPIAKFRKWHSQFYVGYNG